MRRKLDLGQVLFYHKRPGELAALSSHLPLQCSHVMLSLYMMP